MHIAILGAESTGKSHLAQALVAALPSELTAVWVPEYLREWCEREGRTPQPHEQLLIAHTQAQRALAQRADIVLVDTTPLVTAVYSDVLFGDSTLYPFALEHQRLYGLCLLAAPDLPWEADGIQRDGPAQRQRIDRRLREVLLENHIGFSSVVGQGQARTQCALAAVHSVPPLRDLRRLDHTPWQWRCEKCSDAQCEHQLFTKFLQKK